MSKNDDVLAELMRPTSRRRKNWTDKLSDEHRRILFLLRRKVQAGECEESQPNLYHKFVALSSAKIVLSTFFGFMSDNGTSYPEPEGLDDGQKQSRRRRTR